MRYRLVIHFRSNDALPESEDFDTARAAARRRRELRGQRVAAVSIYAIDRGHLSRLSPAGLAVLARAERQQSPGRRLRKAVAGALLGMLASALPSAFGDFGVVSASGMARSARSSQRATRRPVLTALG